VPRLVGALSFMWGASRTACQKRVYNPFKRARIAA
jgi:hypothetical protein